MKDLWGKCRFRGGYTTVFISVNDVKADDISDNLSIRIASVNNARPQNAGFPIIAVDDMYDVVKEIHFGGRKWKVLAREGRRVLVISTDIIDKRRFDSSGNIWANSEIRAYLNGPFYNSFSATDRAKIGTHSTGDKIFLLSREEAERYLRSNTERVARDTSGSASWWWLRSPGGSSYGAAHVHGDGDLIVNGFDVNYASGGVRPALWLNL